jgi:CRP-like cAMP-binding protein
MLLHRLRRFAAYAELGPGDLARVAAHTRELRLPAGRWLVRPGRELSGSYFLDRGRVQLHQPDAVVEASSPRARLALYPAARGVATLTAVNLLQVDSERVAGLFQESRGPEPSEPGSNDGLPPTYESGWLTDGWESRFLGTHIMQRLQPGQWQKVLQGMRRISLPSGQPVLIEGEPADEFYVLCAGAAEVRSRGECVAQLQPGDFFGEDGLITGRYRNATVVMVSDGSVMALAGELFRSELLPLTLETSVPAEQLVALNIGQCRELRDCLSHLQADNVYRIVGGSAGQRALAAFILTQHGYLVSAFSPPHKE